jgi:glycosyltransferase involved in cell wall biosynthesis
MGDGAVTVSAHDVFYAPDYFPGGVAEANRAGLYAEWKKAGVELNFLVHDILPVLRPEFFPPQADALHGRWLDGIADQADRLICVSAAVAEETATWLRGRARNRRTVTELRVLHHGADIAASAPSAGMPDSAAAVLHLLSAAPSFLMVGTIEPRKGHLQTLAAFEQLWSEGRQVNLVIVGKEGWIGLEPAQRRTIPAIVDRLQNHPELGKRLFWLQGISDEYLEHIYATSACLLAPSEGEGFGLPLIESARHTLPIIARDLPVFREVAHDHALYFSGLAASDLRDAIVAWMELRAQGAAPSSAAMTWRTWAQNTDELCAILFAQAANRHAA